MTKIVKRRRRVAHPGVLIVGVVLLTGGCVSSSSDLLDSLDSDNDNTLSRDEWVQGFDQVDRNGDGVVASAELAAIADRGPPDRVGGDGGGDGGGSY